MAETETKTISLPVTWGDSITCPISHEVVVLKITLNMVNLLKATGVYIYLFLSTLIWHRCYGRVQSGAHDPFRHNEIMAAYGFVTEGSHVSASMFYTPLYSGLSANSASLQDANLHTLYNIFCNITHGDLHMHILFSLREQVCHYICQSKRLTFRETFSAILKNKRYAKSSRHN